MLAKIKAYWGSRLSNIHAALLFLGGLSGYPTLLQMHVPDSDAKFICGAALFVSAILFTPGQ